MDIEFIYTRSSGQRVLIQSRVKLLFNCDCWAHTELHPHADSFYLDAVTDVDTEDRVVLEPGELMEVEEEAIGLAHEDVA